MDDERNPYVAAILLCLVGIGLLVVLAALPYILPAHHYTAYSVGHGDDIELTNQTLIEGADMNESIVLFDDLSPQEQVVVEQMVSSHSTDGTLSNTSVFRGVSYVVSNSTPTLYRVEKFGEDRFSIRVLRGRDALIAVAVPIHVFSDSTAFYAPESKEQIARSTIRDGEHDSPEVLDVNRTAVSYKGRYYLLNETEM